MMPRSEYKSLASKALAGDLIFTWILCTLLSGANGAAAIRPLPPRTLPQRVDSLEISVETIEAGNYELKIASLASELNKLKKDMNTTQSNMKYIQSDINYMFSEQNKMDKEIRIIRADMTAVLDEAGSLNIRVLDIENNTIPDIVKKVAHLHTVNQKWRANFIVINKTFDEMRRKNMNTGRG